MTGLNCGLCYSNPCVCDEREYKKNIRDGKIAIESMWQAMAHLSRWRMKFVKWIWPDIVHVAKDLQEYYWGEK